MVARRSARILASASVAIAAGFLSTSGCAKVPAKPETTVPTLTEATGQARCGVRRSADKPLVVEWPAADRAALEAHVQRGLVAVRYEGCAMEVLTTCDVPGAYEYVALSPKQERVSIRNADELYARLPVGAASLEGTLEARGELVIDMSIVGRQQADRHVITRDELTGRCDGATHVLTGLTVGAFTMMAGRSTELGAKAELGPAGAGGSHARASELLTRDGDALACTTGASEDGTPPPGCRALLRVEAVPLAGEPVAATPSVPSHVQVDPVDAQLQRKREDRRAAAWRGTAIASGVLSGASLGGIMGGAVLIIQSNDQPVWEDPSPANQEKKRIGTAMLISSSIGAIGFGALALGAAAASRRTTFGQLAITPSFSGHGGGLQLVTRF